VTLQDAMPVLQIGALAVNGLLVLVIFPLRSAIEELKASDDKLSERIHGLELEVAKNYVARGDMDKELRAISTKLDRIDARLSAKVETLEHEKQDRSNG
jgi:hypothetical protein